MELREYLRPDGTNPYRRWFDSLDSRAAAKVAIAIMRLSVGNTSNIKWFKGIGEYVIDWGPGYRIYLAQDGKELIVLFGGGTKKRQARDIAQARVLHDEYRRRTREQ
jgi:putative addiction module killer protein